MNHQTRNQIDEKKKTSVMKPSAKQITYIINWQIMHNTTISDRYTVLQHQFNYLSYLFQSDSLWNSYPNTKTFTNCIKMWHLCLLEEVGCMLFTVHIISQVQQSVVFLTKNSNIIYTVLRIFFYKISPKYWWVSRSIHFQENCNASQSSIFTLVY